jgi:5-methyltetrahydrofolate--homocysteine methyltransferase
LFKDGKFYLEKVLKNKVFKPKAVYRFFEAHSEGDDVKLFVGGELVETFHFLRQQKEKAPNGSPPTYYCLADYVAPKGIKDYMGAFVVTMGQEVEDYSKALEADGDEFGAIMVKVLGDRLAEACTEWLHLRVRRELGIDENLSLEDLLREKYRGIRPAPGYPACPDHTEKGKIWKLLKVRENIGVELTESYMMKPGSSVSGYFFHHPESKYFQVGKLGRDQIADYAQRKGWSVEEAERWLGPYLDY